MKAVYAWAGVVLGVVACASVVRADPYNYYPQQAPGAWGPGAYATNPWCAPYSPCPPLYHPPCPPVGGVCPPACLPCSPPCAMFPSHPFARSPRDYFMQD
ncbi:MAG TPA: hypothetical protein VG013_32530 [Gemmataceae bacterium]|jgi:hypothetical protein|nr:hypothetical protein [Gemmataceae bacterium]